MAAVGWGAYKPEHDVQGSEWAREREGRRVDALTARAVFEARRREEADELWAELWLSGDLAGGSGRWPIEAGFSPLRSWRSSPNGSW
ncbi:hypothetical protein [Streptomyces sp. NPDC003032]